MIPKTVEYEGGGGSTREGIKMDRGVGIMAKRVSIMASAGGRNNGHGVVTKVKGLVIMTRGVGLMA